MFCPKCGKENPANNKFCNKCGASLAVDFTLPQNISANDFPTPNIEKTVNPKIPQNDYAKTNETRVADKSPFLPNKTETPAVTFDDSNSISKPTDSLQNKQPEISTNLIIDDAELEEILDNLSPFANNSTYQNQDKTIKYNKKTSSETPKPNIVLEKSDTVQYPDLASVTPPKSKKKIYIFSGIAILGLILLASIFGVLLIFISNSKPTSENTKITNPNSSTNSNQSQTLTAPAGMVYISGGEFMLGNEKGDEFEKPLKKVAVKPFYIDVYEVTCADYKKFIDAVSYKQPQNWTSREIPAGWEKRPVTGVNWDDANAYAKWAGKRLPTESEWEFAARGTDNRIYPWGNDWQENAANANKINKEMKDVGSHQGKSPFGLFDMVGNAWEWMADDAKFYGDGKSIKSVTQTLSPKVIRGGYYESPKEKATATVRAFWGARDESTYQNVGFRCVKD